MTSRYLNIDAALFNLHIAEYLRDNTEPYFTEQCCKAVHFLIIQISHSGNIKISTKLTEIQLSYT